MTTLVCPTQRNHASATLQELEHLTNSFGQLKQAQAKFLGCMNDVGEMNPETARACRPSAVAAGSKRDASLTGSCPCARLLTSATNPHPADELALRPRQADGRRQCHHRRRYWLLCLKGEHKRSSQSLLRSIVLTSALTPLDADAQGGARALQVQGGVRQEEPGDPAGDDREEAGELPGGRPAHDAEAAAGPEAGRLRRSHDAPRSLSSRPCEQPKLHPV
jgi:hypothetical protein